MLRQVILTFPTKSYESLFSCLNCLVTAGHTPPMAPPTGDLLRRELGKVVLVNSSGLRAAAAHVILPLVICYTMRNIIHIKHIDTYTYIIEAN